MKQLENKRKKKKRAGRIEKRDKKGLNIYSPTGRLLHTAKKGFCLNYQVLLKRKREEKGVKKL